MSYSITGIQQVGIGVENMEEAWRWYRKQFGMDVPIFRDSGVASYMKRYTGGEGRKRDAVLAMSMHGGGAFEVWQYTERTPLPPEMPIRMGDLGINAVILKSASFDKGFELHKNAGITLLNEPVSGPGGNLRYPVSDPYTNLFFIEEDISVFHKTEHPVGGVKGVLIGVTDIEESMKIYAEVLGYDRVAFDVTDRFDDLAPLPEGDSRFRRVRLERSGTVRGGFGPLFGAGCIELLQALDFKPRKIFENRYWGDQGYIHVCLDVRRMDELKHACEQAGFPFTVDSNDAFDMGEANGRFAYTEDPDGTLVELVEAFKVPILKKLGLYLNLDKRDPEKPVPKWMLKSLRFSRVRDRD